MGLQGSKKNPGELSEENIRYVISATGLGYLTKKTFTKVYENFYKSYNENIKAEDFCFQVFDAFDLDQNGSIDFIEFLLGLSFANSDDIRKRLHLVFKTYDLDKNGFIAKREMEKVIIAIYKMIGQKKKNDENDPKKRVNAVFKIMDTNNDGVLTEEEFVNGCLKDPILMKAIT